MYIYVYLLTAFAKAFACVADVTIKTQISLHLSPMPTYSSDQTSITEFPPNPDYGSGCFRRRIRLTGTAGQVIAELEDSCHAFRATLCHDGKYITALNAETLRIPFNTCVGATHPIQALVGLAVGSDPKTVNESVNPFSNCTHLFDLSVLAIAHAARGETTRTYDVMVEDERGAEPANAVAYLDDKEILRFKTREWELLGPPELRGKPLFRGFAAWANDYFQGDEREAAFVLQKGYFVSSARRIDSRKIEGSRATDHPHIPGACHTYSDAVIGQARRLPDTIRDFSNTPEQLLRFK